MGMAEGGRLRMSVSNTLGMGREKGRRQASTSESEQNPLYW